METVKQAVFNTGAGKIGDYDQCCWQVKGQGQFRPLPVSDPFIGEAKTNQPGELESVVEYRVELVCENDLIREAVAAMKVAHPYEEPAYDVWPLSDI